MPLAIRSAAVDPVSSAAAGPCARAAGPGLPPTEGLADFPECASTCCGELIEVSPGACRVEGMSGGTPCRASLVDAPAAPLMLPLGPPPGRGEAHGAGAGGGVAQRAVGVGAGAADSASDCLMACGAKARTPQGAGRTRTCVWVFVQTCARVHAQRGRTHAPARGV